MNMQASRPALAVASTSLFPVIGHMDGGDRIPTTVAVNGADFVGSGANNVTRFALGQLLIDPGARRGYQVLSDEVTTNGSTQWQTEIRVYDLDRFSLIRRSVIPLLQLSGFTDPGQHAFESFPAALRPGAHPAMFLIAGAVSAPVGVNPGDLVTVDLSTMTVTSMSIQPTVPACADGLAAVPLCPTFGLTYEPRSGLVWAYVTQTEVNTQVGQPTYTFGLEAIDPIARKVVATAPLPASCNATDITQSQDFNNDQIPVFRSADGAKLWTVCVQEQAAEFGTVTSAASIPLTSQGLPAASTSPTVYSGLFSVPDVYADPAADRLIFRQNVTGDRSAVIFDGPHGAFVGAAGLGSEAAGNKSPSYTGNGVDPSTGRFYNMSDAGMFLVDARRTDRQGFPQATVLPTPARGWSGDRPVAVDPVTHHVFVLGCILDLAAGTPITGTGQQCETSYTVYQDKVPLSTDVPLTAVDSNTNNVPLVPGSTVAIYAGHAQGFGSRTYTYNPASVLPNTPATQPNPAGGTTDVIDAGATTVSGEGSGADLTNNGASGLGITADADGQTQQQYAKSGQAFPYKQVPCDDSAGTEAKAQSSGDPAGSTQVDCNLTGGAASVTSAYRSSDAANGALPSTSPAESTISGAVTYVTNCPVNPLCNGMGSGPSIVSTATATVQGIDLAAAVSISYLQITATSVAGGRAGTAVTKYVTTIRGVHAGAYDCSATCDPTSALQQINSALAQELPGQVQVSFPAADAAAAAGTPKGYYAAVEKDSYALLNSITVSGNSRPELVGLEEIRDNAVLFSGAQAKQITEYGGVEVESRFGITPLDLGSPSTGTGAITASVSTPGSAGTPGQFVPGSTGTSTASASGEISAGQRGASGGTARGPLAAIVNGLAWLLDWTQLPLMSLMWIVLLLPAYLAVRRRRLEVLAL